MLIRSLRRRRAAYIASVRRRQARALMVQKRRQKTADRVTRASLSNRTISRPISPTKAATSRLKLAKQLIDLGNTDAAKRWLKGLIKAYPGTPQAIEAKQHLDKL